MISDMLFSPKTIAVVGVPRDEHTQGYQLLKNLVKGCAFYNKYCTPYAGKVFVVSEDAEYILGFKCYPSLAKIHESIDLVFVQDTKDPAKVVIDCIKKNVSFIFLLQNYPQKILEKVVALIEKKKTRIIGPCAGGFIHTPSSINASHAPTMPREGVVSFLTQSEDIFHLTLDGAQEEQFGFRSVLQYGREADLDVIDFLTYFLQDEGTKALALYLESIKDGRRFLQEARVFTRKKPLFILKGGAHDPFYDLACKHVGAYQVETIEELFTLSQAVAQQPAVQKELALLSNSASVAALLQRQAAQKGISFLALKESTLKKCGISPQEQDSFFLLDPQLAQQKNQIEQLFKEEQVKGCVYIHVLTPTSQPEDIAKMLTSLKKEHFTKTIFVVGLSGKYTEKAGLLLDAEAIPHFGETKHAVDALHALFVTKKI